MFSENKSELSIPVVGFILLGFIALFAGIVVLNSEWDFLNNVSGLVNGMVFIVTGILLLLIAIKSFKQIFLIEGMAFGMMGMFMTVMGLGAVGLTSLGLLGIALTVVAIIVAAMSYRAGDIFVVLISIFTIVAFFPMYFADDAIAIAISAIGFIAIAVISLIYAIMDWMLVQDIAADIAEYMYGDDGDACGCACGCEEHKE